MTDPEFLDAVERGAIPPAEFNHESHVRLAFLRLRSGSLESAVAQIRQDLQAFAARAGRPEIYDDALTLQWMERVHERMRDEDDWVGFRHRESDLFNRSVIQKDRAPADDLS